MVSRNGSGGAIQSNVQEKPRPLGFRIFSYPLFCSQTRLLKSSFLFLLTCSKNHLSRAGPARPVGKINSYVPDRVRASGQARTRADL